MHVLFNKRSQSEQQCLAAAVDGWRAEIGVLSLPLSTRFPPPRTEAGSGTACRCSQLPLNPAGWKQWCLSLRTQEDTASKLQLLREPHDGFTDLGFSHPGIHFIGERCSNNENGLIFIQEKAKEEDREKLGEKEETIPPDYRLEEAKVNRPGSFFLTYFHSYWISCTWRRDMGTDLGYKSRVS